MKTEHVEAAKEVGRWLFLFILSWFISQTLSQIGKVPEFQIRCVWVFCYNIPIRAVFAFLLTLAGRYVDKWLHIKGKIENNDTMAKGIVGF